MTQLSPIEWTDATWNPTRGCTKIAPGCAHCYAETFAELRQRPAPRVARRSDAHTVTAKDRLGLVTVTIDGEEFVIADIGMRMLQPRELARAQGFPDSYVLIGTKSEQVARIGNSVPPQFADAIVSANLDDETEVAA